MNNLEDIQDNTSEFNIKFHMKTCIAKAMMQVFMFPPNKAKVEEMMKINVEPIDAKEMIIANAFSDMVTYYLRDQFDGEEQENEQGDKSNL